MAPPAPRRRRRGPGLGTVIVIVGLLVLVGVGVLTWDSIGTRDEAGTLADQTATACAIGGDAARQLDELGACEQAATVQESTSGPVLVQAAGVDEARVIDLVRRELDARPPAPAGPAGEPGQPPSIADVQAAARSVLEANPELYRGVAGQQGPGPSDEQVRAAAAAVIAADPAAFRGDPGLPGEQGQTGPDGAQGEPGQRGRGIVDVRTEGCFVVLVFDQAPAEETVGPFCAVAAEPGPDPETPTTTPPVAEPTPDGGGGGLLGGD